MLETAHLELKKLTCEFMSVQREKQTWNLLRHEGTLFLL